MRKTVKVQGFKVTRVHPVEETTMELSFISEIKSFGKFPNAKNVGSGIMTLYPHRGEEASFQGTIMTAEVGTNSYCGLIEKSGLEVTENQWNSYCVWFHEI